MSKIILTTGLCLLLASAGCKRQATEQEKPQRQVEACSLLKAEEIQEVQGAAVKDSKSSEHSDGRFHISQCYFAADPSHRSVSLALTQADPANPEKNATKELWKQNFRQAAEEKRENEGEKEKRESLAEQKRRGEEEEGGRPMKKIEGIGEEAYWAGSRVGGALYVLKGSSYIRISLGGPDTEEAKIEKSKKLAQKALDRL